MPATACKTPIVTVHIDSQDTKAPLTKGAVLAWQDTSYLELPVDVARLVAHAAPAPGPSLASACIAFQSALAAALHLPGVSRIASQPCAWGLGNDYVAEVDVHNSVRRFGITPSESGMTPLPSAGPSPLARRSTCSRGRIPQTSRSTSVWCLQEPILSRTSRRSRGRSACSHHRSSEPSNTEIELAFVDEGPLGVWCRGHSPHMAGGGQGVIIRRLLDARALAG